MSLTATWTKLAIPALQRSSHSLSIIAGKAHIWGGELEPRRPVDTDMHVVDLASGGYTRIPAPGAPSARVAHAAAAVDGKIFVFGGRGGPEMAPIDEAGMVYIYDPASATWSSVTPAGRVPQPRSYHSAAAGPGVFVIHGGCAAVGRLGDTWAFDVGAGTWRQLADAPGLGRGGTALAVAGGKVFRFGGFDGTTEAGGAIDALSLGGGGGWVSAVFGAQAGLSRHARDAAAELVASTAGPGPRSVCGLHAVDGRLVLLYGEGRPSATGGHDAAGAFWDDVWAYDAGKDAWAQVDVGSTKPPARGWFASDAEGAALALQGGLDGSNARLSDMWVLRFE